MEKVPLTRTGAVRLEAEMKKLKSIERPTIIRAIAEARELGDLKENAEYHSARACGMALLRCLAPKVRAECRACLGRMVWLSCRIRRRRFPPVNQSRFIHIVFLVYSA